MESILLIFLSVSIILSIIALTSIIFIQKMNKLPNERATEDRRYSARRQWERRISARGSMERRNNDRRSIDRRVKDGTIFNRKNVWSIFLPALSGLNN